MVEEQARGAVRWCAGPRYASRVLWVIFLNHNLRMFRTFLRNIKLRKMRLKLERHAAMSDFLIIAVTR